MVDAQLLQVYFEVTHNNNAIWVWWVIVIVQTRRVTDYIGGSVTAARNHQLQTDIIPCSYSLECKCSS